MDKLIRTMSFNKRSCIYFWLEQVDDFNQENTIFDFFLLKLQILTYLQSKLYILA